MTEPVCDVCGKPATSMSQDIQEIKPVDGWRNWERKGSPVYGCDDHPARRPAVYKLDGQQDHAVELNNHRAYADTVGKMLLKKLKEDQTDEKP